MLLNKYEKYSLISKDDYAEELLFKIEKNVNNFKTLQDRAFPYLHAIIEIFTNQAAAEDQDSQEEEESKEQEEEPTLSAKLALASENFTSLQVYAGKFEKLAQN